MTSESFFETIQQQYNSKLPFVVYRNPNVNTVKLFLQKNDTIFKVSSFTESGFLFSPFNSEESAVLIPIAHSKVIKTEYSVEHNNELSSIDFSDNLINKQNHLHLIQNAIDDINVDKFQKVVLSRCETVELFEVNPIQIFKRLLNAYATAFVYCWYHPKIGLWIGATPETLLKVKENRFSTMALAGTKDYNGSLNVTWQEKEKEEQQIVTNFIVDSLKPLVNDLHVSETKTIKAGHLLHLRSEISGTYDLKESGLKNLINQLHPTPAVCGFPKIIAKQFILNNENYNREFYTGFLGELDIDNEKKGVQCTELFVNLRCMQLKNDEAKLYVGGGITKDSIPESEWQETVSKSLVMKNML
ncbi:MAG: chorismate-binding protein [Bacteroidetes bacterium]|nr:chorismate-binding protein [Bacteroidota bacterium]